MPKKKLFWFNYIANSKFYTLHIYYIQIWFLGRVFGNITGAGIVDEDEDEDDDEGIQNYVENLNNDDGSDEDAAIEKEIEKEAIALRVWGFWR